jgi:hypothetical protein
MNVLARLVARLRGRSRPQPPEPIAAAEAEAALYAPWERWRVWKRAFAQRPGDALAIRYGRALVEALRYDEALALLAGVDRAPAVVRARIRLIERIGALTAAHDAARAFAADRPDDPAAAAEANRLAREIGCGGAPPRRALPKTARDLPAARAEAAAQIAANRPADALAILAEVARIGGGADDAARLMNATLLVGAADDGTRLAYDGARRFPRDPRFPRKLAQLAERDEDFGAALLGYRAALSLDRGSAVDTAGIARALALGGEIVAARDWLDQQPAGDLSFWVAPLRAFVEMRGSDRIAAEAALDTAYDHGRRILAAYRNGRARDPADMFMLDEVHLSHLSDPLAFQGREARARYVRSLDMFDGLLARLHERSTILVGNSPRLLGQDRGGFIDGHGTVIRLNDFRIGGFEGDVGRRTDAWISSANRQAEPDHASIRDALAVLIQPHAAHCPELPAFVRGRLGLDLTPDRACFLPPFLHRLGDALLYPVPSTGMRAMLMLEFVVQAPFAVAGFDFFAGDAMHYFDRGAPRHRVGESHAVGFERAFATEVLAELGRFVRF